MPGDTNSKSKRYFCWPFGRLRAGLKLIVNHGELIEPRLVASVPRRRGLGVVGRSNIIVDLGMV